MPNSKSREGFALAVTVFALVLLGALTTTGFYVARQETRMGVASQRATAAFYLAERGAMTALTEWQGTRFARLPKWSSATMADTVADGFWTVDVTRMTNHLYFLQATGSITEGASNYGQASRRLGIVARLKSVRIDPQAALSTVGNLTIGGRSTIVGADSIPPGWDGYCDPTESAKPGVLIDDLSNISREGKAHDVEGDPPIAADNTLTSEGLLDFGEFDWESLVALADLVFSDGSHVTQIHPDSALVGGAYVCQTNNKLNWGDPYNPQGACGAHFPVIYAAGSMQIDAHDYGQGILLVEEDLILKGGFEFFGPVIVRGTVLTEGTGGHFKGGLIAANISLTTSTVLGDAMVQYSSCAVDRAVLNSALTQVRPLDRRSFADLSSVVGG